MMLPREDYGQQPAVGRVLPQVTPIGAVPVPRKPIPNLPPPPDDEHDTAQAWADYAAELFRARADWRMVRAVATVSMALAAVEALA